MNSPTKTFHFLQNSNLSEAFDATHLYFSNQVDKFEVNHYLMRRLGLLGMFMALFGLFAISLQQFGIFIFESLPLFAVITDSNIEMTYSAFDIRWFDIGLVLILVFVLVFNGVVSVNKIEHGHFRIMKLSPIDRRALIEAKKQILRVMVYLLTVSVSLAVFAFPWDVLAPHFLFWGLLGSSLSAIINARMGYTKAWSRNRLARQHVEILFAEWQSDLDSEQGIRHRLFRLVETSCQQAQSDITGLFNLFSRNKLM